MELREIIAAVEGDRLTLSLCNVDAPPRVVDAVGRYFEPRHVVIRRTSTDRDNPTNVALLHDGEQFRAASGLRDLYRFVDPRVGANTTTDIEALDVPAVVRELDDSTFSDYGKERMIVASREIEKRAWEVGSGEIHTGFQRLSLVESQQRIYRKLAETGLDVHVYGVPDADPPDVGATVHGIDTREVAESWFVVFEPDAGGSDVDDSDVDDSDADGPDPADDSTGPGKAVLLARETAEANTYRGFWTYRESVVDDVLDRLRGAYLE